MRAENQFLYLKYSFLHSFFRPLEFASLGGRVTRTTPLSAATPQQMLF